MTEEATATVEQRLSAQTSNREEEVRVRAYELYLERDGAPGDAEGDWFRAESEIAQKSGEQK